MWLLPAHMERSSIDDNSPVVLTHLEESLVNSVEVVNSSPDHNS